jgi:hypothetical protein
MNLPYREEFAEALRATLENDPAWADLDPSVAPEATVALVLMVLEEQGVKLPKGNWPGYRIPATGPPIHG